MQSAIGPCISMQGKRVTPTRLIGIPLTACVPPIAHRFVRHDDPACSHHLLDIPVAQAEAAVEPDAMTEDLRRKAVTFVERNCGWCYHAVPLSLHRFVVGGNIRRCVRHKEQRLYRCARLFDKALRYAIGGRHSSTELIHG
jgi:hypothetical protein